MKLDRKAKQFVDDSFFAKLVQLASLRDQKLMEIRVKATLYAPATAEVINYHTDTAHELINTKIHLYAAAYRKVNQTIDEEDKDEIVDEIKVLVERHLLHFLTDSTIIELKNPHTGERRGDLDDYISRRFRNLIGEGAVNLRSAASELNLDISLAHSIVPPY